MLANIDFTTCLNSIVIGTVASFDISDFDHLLDDKCCKMLGYY